MDETALIERTTDVIPVRKVLGYSVPGYIKVSRNAIHFVAVKQMNAIQMNVIMTIVDALQKALIYANCYPYKDIGEVEILIPWRAVCGHHDPKIVLPSILTMLNMKLAYRYTIENEVSPVITNVISSAEYRGGQYYITVPAKALSWFLYCGKNVGYAKIERHVFLAITSVREKTLYLRLMTQVDQNTKMGTWDASVDDLRELLGYEMRDTFARINCRVIRPLMDHLKEYGSNYVIYARQNKVMTGRKGKPAVKGVLFEIDGSHRFDECYQAAAELLATCWSVWDLKAKGCHPITSPEICHSLGDRIPGFIRRCNRAGEKYKEKMEKSGKYDSHAFVCWRANIVAKILWEDYGIEVFKK